MTKYCEKCGYEFNGTENGGCPSCGHQLQNGTTPMVLAGAREVALRDEAVSVTVQQVFQQAPRSNGMCVAGFILSFLFPPLGLILSAVGISQAKKSGQSSGLGTAGLVLGILFTVPYFLMLMMGVFGI